MDVLESLRAFFREELVVDHGGRDIAADEDLLASGVIDSLGATKLVLFIEETYQIRVQDSDVVPDNFRNLASIARFIASKQGSAAGSQRQRRL
jgi:acyl carrier protein